MIRIGFDAKRYFRNASGLGNYSRWLVDGMGSEDVIEAVLFHPGNEKHSEWTTKTPTGICKSFPSLWRSKFVVQDILSSGVQIYHGLSNELPHGIHTTPLKTVVTIHDLINLRYPDQYKFIDRLIYKQKLEYAQSMADAIVVPSTQTQEDLSHFFKTPLEKIHVIPLGLSPISRSVKMSLPKTYILCFSGFSKRKNIARLVDAYLQSDLPGIDLIVAGKKGDSFTEVKQKADLHDRIHLFTDVSEGEKSELYKNALFCIYPSLFEGFGIPIIEAFQFGKTVATSNVSSMPEVGGDAATYFNPLNVDEIVHALETLVDDKIRDRFEKNIHMRLKKFETEAILRRYLKLYQLLATG